MMFHIYLFIFVCVFFLALPLIFCAAAWLACCCSGQEGVALVACCCGLIKLSRLLLCVCGCVCVRFVYVVLVVVISFP